VAPPNPLRAVAWTAESPVALECRPHSTLPVSDCVLVFGEVIRAVVVPGVLVAATQGSICWNDWYGQGLMSGALRGRWGSWSGFAEPIGLPDSRPRTAPRA